MPVSEVGRMGCGEVGVFTVFIRRKGKKWGQEKIYIPAV